MKPLWIIDCVGLTPGHIGSATPALNAYAGRGFAAPMQTVVPAVTTTAQTTMLTGVSPQEHGIVGNGWYFRDQAEVWLWRQSEGLVQAPLAWQGLTVGGRPLKVLKHFWWYAMNTTAQATVTPRPAYHADGAKSPDFYARPIELKTAIENKHGAFPLFQFWGPTAAIASTTWIAESFVTAADHQQPDLALCYLPHLDYDLQRHGPTGDHLSQNLKELDDCVAHILTAAEERGAEVLVVSEYGIESVNTAIPINRRLRERGLLEVQTNATGELLDPGASKAFAVADHQIAHIYSQSADDIQAAEEALEGLSGIDRVYRGADRADIGLDHDRAGDLVVLADQGCWFLYDYWFDEAKAPDFAQCVEIHKKPGYDPRELFFDPKGGKFRAAKALLKKKLGLRYRMNPVPLDPSLVKGSHGRIAAKPEEGAVIIGPSDLAKDTWTQADVATVIRHYF